MREIRVFILMAVLLLTAFIAIDGGTQAEEPTVFTGGHANVYSVLIDEETGCQYIEAYVGSTKSRVIGKGVTITPRLDSGGQPMCGKSN